MASNREERLQMRQRGAGTRKIQAVNFGFSFGSPAAANQSTTIAQNSETAPAEEGTSGIDSLVAKPLTPPVNDESSTRIPTPTLRTPRASIAAGQSPRRSSARRSVGRASLSNTVDEQDEGRSSKRRRISTEKDRSRPTSASKSTPIANAIPSATRADGQQIESQQNGIVDDGTNPELATTAAVAAAANGVGDNNIHETVHLEQETDPEQEVVRTSRRGRAKTITGPPQEDSNRGASGRDKRPVRRQSQINGLEPREDLEEDQSKASSRKRKRGLGKQPGGEDRPQDDHEPGHENAESRANKRRQKPKDAELTPEREEEADEENESTQQGSRGKGKPLGRPARDIESVETQQDDTTTQTRRKRKGKQRETEHNAETVERQDDTTVAQGSRENEARKKQQESGGLRRRGRPSLDKAQQPQPEAETTAQTTENTDNQSRTGTEQGQTSKRRRGRPSGVANGNETTSRQRTRRRDVQDETAEGGRRTGGTVSITVHRLTNTRALDTHADSSSSDHEQDSSDELQLEATGKRFPSRTGVNAADVLSQICKEILEKHVAALDNNIANDTASQSKRSEYVRQRKAVEAYGTQLEGRLFELSELLDSNFTLGVQLKKAKREAAEMRKRLLAVRQQRHEITLQMDAVRRKHGEEESAKMSRNAINNALHNLELTLDRSRVRPDSNDSGEKDTGIAGLEFLLRSVSDKVSSAAEGSQGGLLKQVKAFNAQLERAAKKLER